VAMKFLTTKGSKDFYTLVYFKFNTSCIKVHISSLKIYDFYCVPTKRSAPSALSASE